MNFKKRAIRIIIFISLCAISLTITCSIIKMITTWLGVPFSLPVTIGTWLIVFLINIIRDLKN